MAPHETGLTLGVISDSALHRRHLAQFSERLHIDLCINTDARGWREKQFDGMADCWLVETEDSAVLETIEGQDAAMVLGELSFFDGTNSESYRAHADHRLLKTISQAVRASEKARGTASQLEGEVWLLAASLGGPEAVKQFVDKLDRDLPCTFLYAQHLDQVGLAALTKVITRDAALPISEINGLTALSPGMIHMVPSHCSINFCDLGAYPSPMPWKGSYAPSISHLLERALRQFGHQLNVIFFSGMGDDGSAMAKRLADNGCQVWAQAPESCVSSAMPTSVIDKNICQLVDEPTGLAKALMSRFDQLRGELKTG